MRRSPPGSRRAAPGSTSISRLPLAALLLVLHAGPARADDDERPFSTFSAFTRVPYRVATVPGYVAGGAAGAAICIPIAFRSGDYGGCTVQMADGFSNAVGTLLASPFALLEWAFWRGPRRLLHKEKPAAGKVAPPPAGLMFEVALPAGTRLVGGLAGPLRLEPGETMTHAVEHDGTATPVTFGYDAARQALTVDEASFPLKPPYPQKLRVTAGGVGLELFITPIAP